MPLDCPLLPPLAVLIPGAELAWARAISVPGSSTCPQVCCGPGDGVRRKAPRADGQFWVCPGGGGFTRTWRFFTKHLPRVQGEAWVFSRSWDLEVRMGKEEDGHTLTCERV